MTLGLAAHAVGGFIYTYLVGFLEVEPFPSLADGFFLLFFPLLAWGFLRLPRLPLRRSESWRLALDVLIVLSAAGLYS